MPLQGNLKEMSLANLIQVNCQEMRSARLTLTHRGQEGEVYFSDGQVVHATLGTRTGEAVLYEMLAWDDGAFVLDREVLAPARSVEKHWHELLLEGMKRLPEFQATVSKGEGNMNNDMVSRLKAIDGVSGVVIASCDGVVLGADVPESDGEREAAVAVFIGSAAKQIGEAMQLGAFEQGVVTLKGNRVLILEQPDRYVGLIIGERTSPTIVASAALQVLK